MSCALQAPLLALRGRHDGIEQRLGGLEQFVSLARPLLGQQRVAAHHEVLARIGVASDLHQVGAVEHLHRHRTALGVAQQPELDLQLAALAVARVAAPPQRAAASFQIHRGEVVQHQRAVLEMASGQPSFDPLLALEQPVHGGVQVVLVAVLQPQRLGERVARGVRRQALGGGQLGTRIEDPGDDHRQHASALGRVRAGDGAIQSQLAQRAELGGDMAVGFGTHDVEGVVEAGHRGAALEQHAQAVDERRGPFGEVGEGAFLDLAGVAEGLAQEHGGGRFAVGDAFDVHGYIFLLGRRKKSR